MINLFFVVHDHSGARTYADQLIAWLITQKNITIHKLFYESLHHREFTIIEADGITEIHFPLTRNPAQNMEKYADRCLDLIGPILEGKEGLIFHLNFCTQVSLGLAVRRRYGAKLIYTLHFLPDFFSYMAYNNRWDMDFDIQSIVLDRTITEEVDHIITVTHFAREAICKCFHTPKSKVTAIHNGYTPIGKTADITRSVVFPEKFGFSPTDQIVLFAGLIEPRKGITELVKAFNLVVRQCPNARLIIVGNGDYDSAMCAMQPNWGRITFVGKIPYPQLEQLYRMSTMGVIPSTFEQCSYVALEMMYNGLPVIACQAPGLVELYAHRLTGWVTQLISGDDKNPSLRVDVEALAEAIVEMLNNHSLRKALTQSCHNQWEMGYTAQHMGHRTLVEYKKLKNKN